MSKKNYQLNEKAIENIIIQTLEENLNNIKPDIADYFVLQTEEKIKNYKSLLDIKNQIQKYYNLLINENDVSLKECFEAYELLLDIRKFFLGELGEVNYSILWSHKEQNGNAKIYDMVISHKLFRSLLLNEKEDQILGLKKYADGGIRMNTVLLASLQNILLELKKRGVDFTIDKNFSNFSIHNEIVGKSQDFKSADLFRAEIENAQKRSSKYAHYNFEMDVTISTIQKHGKEKEVFNYIIKEVKGRPSSSSVFSAIAKYAADEKIAKQQAIFNQYNREIEGSINTGVLTEIYKLAKDILNEGHNVFKRRRYISGQQMYDIFKQIKGNSDPFYMGGDILTDQIKSFLGSCPSLTSFKTIKNGIEKFHKAFSKTDLKELKEELKNILIKDENKQLYKAEQDLSKNLIKNLQTTFNQILANT